MMSKMDPRHLLQWLLDAHNLRATGLANRLKESGKYEKPTTQPQISKFLNGVALEPKRETLAPVADYFKIPLESLYDSGLAESVSQKLKAGVKLSLAATDQSNVVELTGMGRAKNKPDELVIPQFNTGGSMGRGLLLRDQPGVIQGWSVNQEWVNKNVKSHTGAQNLCIVTGFGDSMKGMFNPGDPLLVDSGVKTVDFDAVYFFRVGEEGFVKRLQRIPGEGLRVLSENQKYESWTVRSDMDFEVFGRVLKAWQGEDF